VLATLDGIRAAAARIQGISRLTPLLDLAPTAGEETIMRLGPELRQALRHKVRTMTAHWRDYDRLFTPPNP
jgi:hypothetical protein